MKGETAPRKKPGTAKAVKRESTTGDARSRVAIARKEAFATVDPAAAFAHFRAEAERVPVAGLVVFTGRPAIVQVNVQHALAALEPGMEAVAQRLSDAPLREVFELPALALALGFAVGRVPARKLSEREISAAIEELSPLRAATLSYLEIAASPLLRLVPAERVRAIRAGNGKLDAAHDAVALAGIFEEYGEVLAGRHPFTAEQLGRLSELGAMLVQQIRPGDAPAAPSSRAPASVLRDQFAALLAARYDQLRVLATVAFGATEANARIPALRSFLPQGGTEQAGGTKDAPTG